MPDLDDAKDLMNRRGFLTGALYATGFAALTLQNDMVSEPAEDVKKANLKAILSNNHPELSDVALEKISEEFGDYTINSLRPYFAGAAAATSYAIMASRENPETRETPFTTKINAYFAPIAGIDMGAAAFVPSEHGAQDIYNAIQRHDNTLSEDQTNAVTQTVLFYLKESEFGRPAFLPALLATFLLKDVVEKQLDKQDVNRQGPNDPNGP